MKDDVFLSHSNQVLDDDAFIIRGEKKKRRPWHMTLTDAFEARSPSRL